MGTFTGNSIKNTYQRVIQITGSTLQDALGNEISESLDLTVSNAATASFALTASYALNAGATDDPLVSGSAQITLNETVGNLSGSRITGSVELANTASIALFAVTSSVTVTNQVSSSYAATSSYASTASYIEYNNISNLPNLLSSSNQIESNISGAFENISSSIASDIANISVSFDDISDKPVLYSSSAQIFISESQIVDLVHYSTSNFNTDFSSKTTSDLTESGSLFYTDDRVKSKLNTDNVLSGSLDGKLPSGTVSSSAQINLNSAFGTASLAVSANTASYIAAANIDGIVPNATSASHALQADSSLTADSATVATTATSASYILGSNVDGAVALATTASYALNAQSQSPFPYTGSANISGSLNVVGPVTASAYLASNGLGTPTLTATSTLVLSASAAIQVTGAPLRLPTFTNAQTASLTPQSGDVIYNSDRSGMMLFVGSNWYKVDVTL